ncbi:hypothetical protein TRVL_09936 [Trypanosoma vivax]|nr:hypothetical protein TRVL_09936 [Trypanosoma vivax]
MPLMSERAGPGLREAVSATTTSTGTNGCFECCGQKRKHAIAAGWHSLRVCISGHLHLATQTHKQFRKALAVMRHARSFCSAFTPLLANNKREIVGVSEERARDQQAASCGPQTRWLLNNSAAPSLNNAVTKIVRAIRPNARRNVLHARRLYGFKLKAPQT